MSFRAPENSQCFQKGEKQGEVSLDDLPPCQHLEILLGLLFGEKALSPLGL